MTLAFHADVQTDRDRYEHLDVYTLHHVFPDTVVYSGGTKASRSNHQWARVELIRGGLRRRQTTGRQWGCRRCSIGAHPVDLEISSCLLVLELNTLGSGPRSCVDDATCHPGISTSTALSLPLGPLPVYHSASLPPSDVCQPYTPPFPARLLSRAQLLPLSPSFIDPIQLSLDFSHTFLPLFPSLTPSRRDLY